LVDAVERRHAQQPFNNEPLGPEVRLALSPLMVGVFYWTKGVAPRRTPI
jgi:hypothetical protein